ncbi:hypothetical protein FHL15_011081 [Xylaria flabelliformis]|uniref:Uncharacterized protein n=1 Tax=Xylaria flabelliformis TaxID=2512241 RepID=A0A553HJ97_9PEZI|nr:hypothetical protein FHL15_011081 [Xylaria flabelliformis]
MSKNPARGEYLQADHLVENVLASRLTRSIHSRLQEEAEIDNYDGPELGDPIIKFDIRNPDGNGKVLPPMSFNLVFKSTVGPSTAAPVFTGTPLVVWEALRTGLVNVEYWEASLDKKLVGPIFKRDAKAVQASVEALDQPFLKKLAARLNATGDTATPLADGGLSVELPQELLMIQKATRL